MSPHRQVYRPLCRLDRALMKAAFWLCAGFGAALLYGLCVLCMSASG